MIRPTCLPCATFHVQRAMILIMETQYENVNGQTRTVQELVEAFGPEKGNTRPYKHHRHLAMGHMGEATDELMTQYPAVGNMIRHYRKMMEANEEYIPPFLEILDYLEVIEKE